MSRRFQVVTLRRTRIERLGMLAALVLALAAGASPARAQQGGVSAPGGLVDPRGMARSKFGPVYFTPTFSLDRLGVDTNPLNGAGEATKDFTMVSTPAATLWVPIQHRAVITTQVRSGLTYFQQAASQRGVDPGIVTHGDVRIGRLTLFGEAGKARRHQRANVELDTRVHFVTSDVSAGMSGAVRPRLTVRLFADRAGTEFAGDAVAGGTSLRQSLSRADRGVRLEALERLSSMTTLGVAWEERQDRFTYSPDRNANSSRFTSLLTFAPKALVSGDVEAGFRHFALVDSRVPAFNGLVVKVALTSKILQSTHVSGTWDRDVQFSYDASQSYFVSNQFSASVRRQLTGRYDVVGTVGRGRANYHAPLGALAVEARTDVTSSYSGDVGYRLNPRSRVGFGVAVEHRSARSGVVAPFDAVRAGISFGYGQ